MSPATLHLQSEQWVPTPIDEVWKLFANPDNLAALTPPMYGASVSFVGPLQEGMTVVIAMKPFGITLPLQWISKIHEIQAEGDERQFVDVQASGPFASWKHTHRLVAACTEFNATRSGRSVHGSEGGTWILDNIEYQMPAGVFGQIAHKLFAQHQLENLFAFRKEAVKKLLKLS